MDVIFLSPNHFLKLIFMRERERERESGEDSWYLDAFQLQELTNTWPISTPIQPVESANTLPISTPIQPVESGIIPTEEESGILTNENSGPS